MRRAIAALLTCLALTSGCAGADPNRDGDPFNDDPAREGAVRLQDRPSMEATLAQYRAFQSDLFDALDRRFGHRVWAPVNGQTGITGSACNDALPDRWGIVGLPLMSFKGSYPPEQWQQVRAVVAAVGETHGFNRVGTLVDRPGNLDFAGTDPRYGDTYEFGLGKNTVLLLETGCHRWDKLPTPSPAP